MRWHTRRGECACAGACPLMRFGMRRGSRRRGPREMQPGAGGAAALRAGLGSLGVLLAALPAHAQFVPLEGECERFEGCHAIFDPDVPAVGTVGGYPNFGAQMQAVPHASSPDACIDVCRERMFGFALFLGGPVPDVGDFWDGGVYFTEPCACAAYSLGAPPHVLSCRPFDHTHLTSPPRRSLQIIRSKSRALLVRMVRSIQCIWVTKERPRAGQEVSTMPMTP